MAFVHGRAETAHARRYMTQLAKHWSHKFQVRYDERTAEIPLPLGECRMAAEADHLAIELESGEAAGLERLKAVVAEHLERFAFREPFEVAWTLGEAAAPHPSSMMAERSRP